MLLSVRHTTAHMSDTDFRFRLEQAGVFKHIIEACKDLIKETNFDFDEQGLGTVSMDSSHVAMVVVRINKEAFVEHKLARPKTIGLNMASLCKVLKTCQESDTLTLSNDGEDKLSFLVENGESPASLSMKTMDIDADRLGIPDNLTYSAVVTMSSRRFKALTNEFANFGDTVRIAVSKEGVAFSVKGGDIADYNRLLHSTSTVVGDAKNPDSVHVVLNEAMEEPMTFALKYLIEFAKGSSVASRISLSLKPEMPLCVEYALDSGLGSLKYYLAPKIDDKVVES